jgi:hypothetical protein
MLQNVFKTLYELLIKALLNVNMKQSVSAREWRSAAVVFFVLELENRNLKSNGHAQ